MAKILANEAIRTMTKTAAGMTMGSDAFLLCCVVVMQQDSIKYRRPVSNWNHTLCDILGFNQKQLFRARDRAIEAGWLQYTPGRKSVAGNYLVTIPEHARDCDGTICEEITEDPGNNKGTMCPQSGNNAGTMRETFIPIPEPKPIPIPSINTRSYDGDLFPTGPLANSPRPEGQDDETKWHYEGHMWPWAQKLKRVGAKIGPRNWNAWERLKIDLWNDDIEAMVKFVSSISAENRWPDHIEQQYTKRRPDAIAKLNGMEVVIL